MKINCVKSLINKNIAIIAKRNYYGHKKLKNVDNEMFELIQKEKLRQQNSINLIASEVFMLKS